MADTNFQDLGTGAASGAGVIVALGALWQKIVGKGKSNNESPITALRAEVAELHERLAVLSSQQAAHKERLDGVALDHQASIKDHEHRITVLETWRQVTKETAK